MPTKGIILLLFFSSSWWHFRSAAVFELVALIVPPPPISASCAEEISQQPVGGDQAPSITAKLNPIHLRRLAGQSLKGFFTKQNLRSLSAYVCANGIITALTSSRRSVWRSPQTCPEGGRDCFLLKQLGSSFI